MKVSTLFKRLAKVPGASKPCRVWARLAKDLPLTKKGFDKLHELAAKHELAANDEHVGSIFAAVEWLYDEVRHTMRDYYRTYAEMGRTPRAKFELKFQRPTYWFDPDFDTILKWLTHARLITAKEAKVARRAR